MSFANDISPEVGHHNGTSVWFCPTLEYQIERLVEFREELATRRRLFT